MLVLGPQSVDSTRVYTLQLNDGEGNPLTGVFTGTQTFAAKLWAGDDQAALVDLSGDVAWADQAAAQLALTVPTALVAGLAPGFYRVQATINPGTDDTLALDGAIQLTAAPGAATAPQTYTDAAELQKYAPWLFDLEDLAADQTGFAEARSRARTWVNEQVMARYRKTLRDQEGRHCPVVTLDPIDPTSGIDSGPWWGPSTIPDTTLQADEITMQGYLDSGYLMLDDRIREAAAKRAIGYVCANQIGNAAGTETPWQALAARFRRESVMLLLGVRFRVDSAQTGTPAYEIL